MRRLRIFYSLIIAGILFLCLALAYHQVIQFSKYQQLSQVNRIRILPQSASRGCILDRNGNILASNTLSYNLLIMPQDENFSIEHIYKLSQALSISEKKLKSNYNKGYKVPFVPVSLYKEISLAEAVAIGQLKYDFPEIIIQSVPKRKYPLGRVGCHILGYLGQIDTWRLEWLKEYGYKIQDLVGYNGIEEVYDYILRPRDGGRQVEVDSKGRVSRILGFKAASKGKDIQLNIDLRLQEIVHNSLKRHTGCIIVLNPAGEILALENSPNYNPQVFQDGSPSSINLLLNDSDAPLFNRAINGLYPPGSIFKIVVAAAGLEKKKVDSHSQFFCLGSMQIGDRKFHCWESHREEDIVDALAHSCNVFFYNLGLRLGPQLINEYALQFGLNQQTGIDLSGESTGYLPYSFWQRIKKARRWFAGDTANLSIGQGEILVTPLQIARMMAALANDGKLVKPRLLRSVNESGQFLEVPPSGQAANLPISKETLEIIRRGLIGAVNKPGGTADVLANLGISIAGKTGSAQVSSGQAHGWFAGYFPVNKPRFVICVFLEHIGSGYYCCLLTKNIIEQMLVEGLL